MPTPTPTSESKFHYVLNCKYTISYIQLTYAIVCMYSLMLLSAMEKYMYCFTFSTGDDSNNTTVIIGAVIGACIVVVVVIILVISVLCLKHKNKTNKKFEPRHDSFNDYSEQPRKARLLIIILYHTTNQ